MFLITICIIMSGCYMTQQSSSGSEESQIRAIMQPYMGYTENELLLKWGSPTSTNSDGNGGKILTFEELRRVHTDSFGYITMIH
jgi:hypothetical protein